MQFGALAANIVLGKISDRSKFYYTAVAAGVGALVTMLFIPEVTGLDLSEGDKRWEHLRSGKLGRWAVERHYGARHHLAQ